MCTVLITYETLDWVLLMCMCPTETIYRSFLAYPGPPGFRVTNHYDAIADLSYVEPQVSDGPVVRMSPML